MDLTAIDLADDVAKQNGLVDWARAFAAQDWETVGKIENNGVKEARKTMEVIMSSQDQRRMMLDRRKALLDEKSLLEEAEARGAARGAVFTLADLVRDKVLTLSEAASRAKMSEVEFAKKANLSFPQ